MHLVRMSLGGVPPFTEPIRLKFDERVNVLIGPNASGKSTILLMLADCLNGPQEEAKRPISSSPMNPGIRPSLHRDDSFNYYENEHSRRGEQWNVLTASEDWTGSRSEMKSRSQWADPPVVYIGSIREGLPGISNQESPDAFGETAAEALEGPFNGSRAMWAWILLTEELWSTDRDDLRMWHELR